MLSVLQLNKLIWLQSFLAVFIYLEAATDKVSILSSIPKRSSCEALLDIREDIARDELKPVWPEFGNRPAPTWRTIFCSCVTPGLVTITQPHKTSIWVKNKNSFQQYCSGNGWVEFFSVLMWRKVEISYVVMWRMGWYRLWWLNPHSNSLISNTAIHLSLNVRNMARCGIGLFKKNMNYRFFLACRQRWVLSVKSWVTSSKAVFASKIERSTSSMEPPWVETKAPKIKTKFVIFTNS